jgi:hypothetical protein
LEASNHIQVDPAFAVSLGNVVSLSDCFLTPKEIADNKEATALVQAWKATQAAELGVDPSQVEVKGISFENDNVPGCSDPAVEAMVNDISGAKNMPTLRIRMDNHMYHTSLSANEGIRSKGRDCHLTPEEIGSDAAATALATFYTRAVCKQLKVLNPSQTECEVGSGITVTGIDLADCGQKGVTEACYPTSDDAPGTVVTACATAMDETVYPVKGTCWRSKAQTQTDMLPDMRPGAVLYKGDRVHTVYDPNVTVVTDQSYHDPNKVFPNVVLDTIRDERQCEFTGNRYRIESSPGANDDKCTDIHGDFVHFKKHGANTSVPIQVSQAPTSLPVQHRLRWAENMCRKTGNVWDAGVDTAARRYRCEEVYTATDQFNPFGYNGTCTYQATVVEADTYNTAPEVTIRVSELFANGLGSASAYANCFIEPSELSPAGAAFMHEVITQQAALLDVQEACHATPMWGHCNTGDTFIAGQDAWCADPSGLNTSAFNDIACTKNGLTFTAAGAAGNANATCVNVTTGQTGSTSSLEACENTGNTWHPRRLPRCVNTIAGFDIIQWGGRWGDMTLENCEHGDHTSQEKCERTGFTFIPHSPPDDVYPNGQPARCVETETTNLGPGYIGWVVPDDGLAGCELTGHNFTAASVPYTPVNLTNWCGNFTGGKSGCLSNTRNGQPYSGEFAAEYAAAVNITQCTYIAPFTFPATQLDLLGISMDQDTEAGCQTDAGVGGGVELSLGAGLVGALTNDLNLGSTSTVSASDIDLDGDSALASLANNFLNAICVSMGFTPGSADCNGVQLDGITFSFCSAQGVTDATADQVTACAAYAGSDRTACLGVNPACRFLLDPECQQGGAGPPSTVCAAGDATCANLCRDECFPGQASASDATTTTTFVSTCSSSFGYGGGSSGRRRRLAAGQGQHVPFDDLYGPVVKPTWKFKNGDRLVKVLLKADEH